jgi:hypothetical protein
MSTPKMYRIAWRMKETGVGGCGEFCLTLPQAETWVHSLRHDYPDMEHWVEDEDGDVVMEVIG